MVCACSGLIIVSHNILGDVVMLHGAGKYILSLNSMEAVDDLLVKRGEIFSNRPQFTVVSELMGLGQVRITQPAGYFVHISSELPTTPIRTRMARTP
jgi:hypothetical protein